MRTFVPAFCPIPVLLFDPLPASLVLVVIPFLCSSLFRSHTRSGNAFVSRLQCRALPQEGPLDLTSTTASDRKSEDLQEIHLSFGGHLFLNWSSPAVRERMLDAFRFWLRLGVDGFYLRNVHNMQFQSPDDLFQVLNELHKVMRDEEERIKRKDLNQKWAGDPAAGSHDQGTREGQEQEQEQRHQLPQKRILITSRSSLLTLANKLGKDRNRFSPLKSNFRKRLFQVSQTRIVVSGGKADAGAGARSSQPVHERAGDAAEEADIHSYFHLIDTFLDIRRNETDNIRAQVNEVFLNQGKSEGSTILWNIGSATSSRLVSRVGSEYSAVAAFLLMMLPGSISLFYGDEIGLTDSRDQLSNRVSLFKMPNCCRLFFASASFSPPSRRHVDQF
jgi:hypothetical protein